MTSSVGKKYQYITANSRSSCSKWGGGGDVTETDGKLGSEK